MLRQLEILVVIRKDVCAFHGRMAMRDGVDERIKVEGWQIRVLCLDVHHVRGVIPGGGIMYSGLSALRTQEAQKAISSSD